uniref:Lipoxygenase homology domain-containing protein 1-like n=1 Tax=Tetraselmis sp. GSL018 TaxID=582737 RepID=A0A061R661_9CHLO
MEGFFQQAMNLDFVKKALNQEEPPPAVVEMDGEEVTLDIPTIVTAETTAVASGKGGILGGLGGLNITRGREEVVPSHRLEISIFTSDLEGAGTTAGTFMYFIGDKGTEGPIPLLSNNVSKDNRTSGSKLFQKGSIDTFEVEVSIGRLEQVVLGKEPSKDAWHVLKVIITDKWDGRVLYFPCEQWLSNLRRGLGNEVLLHGWEADQSDKDNRVIYKVIVSTANVPGASCESNAFIAIYGDKGCTGKKWLGAKRGFFRIVTQPDSTVLNKGETVAFLINSFDVGAMKRICIGHDNRGIGDSRWKLESVRVEKYHVSQGGSDGSSFPDARSKFVFGGWLGYGAEDGLCEVTLYPEEEHLSRSRSMRMSPEMVKSLLQAADEPQAPEGDIDFLAEPKKLSGPDFKYKIMIGTSDQPNADYDGSASIEIHGSKGKTPIFDLPGPFRRGVAKEFEDFAPSVGNIEEIMLYAKQFGDSWHLQDIFIEVLDPKNKRVGAYSFACDRWINNFGQPRSLLLMAHDITKAKREQFKILVYTSTEKGAATKDNVYLTIQGKEGKTRPLHLKAMSKYFGRGAVATFFRSTPKLGLIRTIVVAIDAKKTGSWKPEQIEIVDLQENKIYMFPCSEWLRVKDKKSKQWPKKTLRVVQINPNAIKQQNLKCRYKVLLHTSDTDNSETRSNVSFVLSGDQGESGKITVKGGSKRFNRGQMDAIFFDAMNVGDMYKMRLALETRLPTSWNCSYVHAVNIRTGAQAIFIPDGCLATTTGTERQKTMIAAGKGIPPTVVFYKIVVATGNSKESNINSDTADVSIEIYGSQRTVTAALEPAGNEMAFERGTLNVFTIESPYAGSIDSAVISFTSSLSRAKWDLQYVEIIDPKLGEAVEKMTGGPEAGIGDLFSKLAGTSIYLENQYGIIDGKDRGKARLKKASYPRGFKSLNERLESAGFDSGGNKVSGGDGGGNNDGGGGGFGLPKPGMFSMMRMFA